MIKEYICQHKNLFWSILVFILVVVIVILINKPEKFHVYEDHIILKREGVMCELVDQTQYYIDSISPNSALDALLLVDLCLDYDIDLCFVLAQGRLESLYGVTGIARKTNSVWNVYAYDGSEFEEINRKGKYKNPNHSIEPYLKLLKNRYLVDKTEWDLMDEFVDKDGHRYASAEDYEKKLSNIYLSIRSQTDIDNLFLQVKKYNMLLNN